jgi:hypothetical protein
MPEDSQDATVTMEVEPDTLPQDCDLSPTVLMQPEQGRGDGDKPNSAQWTSSQV